MRLSYDKSTDSLYIELRPQLAKRTREIEPDANLDLRADGEPIGYEIQDASTEPNLILSIILAAEPLAAAE